MFTDISLSLAVVQRLRVFARLPSYKTTKLWFLNSPSPYGQGWGLGIILMDFTRFRLALPFDPIQPSW